MEGWMGERSAVVLFFLLPFRETVKKNLYRFIIVIDKLSFKLSNPRIYRFKTIINRYDKFKTILND